MNDIDKARRKKSDARSWTLEELKKKAEEERKGYKGLSADEPDALASGKGMDKILEEKDDEKE